MHLIFLCSFIVTFYNLKRISNDLFLFPPPPIGEGEWSCLVRDCKNPKESRDVTPSFNRIKGGGGGLLSHPHWKWMNESQKDLPPLTSFRINAATQIMVNLISIQSVENV